MSIQIVNYIRERIKQLNPEIDIRPGSVVSDLLINPIVSVLENYTTTQNSILNQQSLQDLDLISEIEMDAIASNFLITRISGTKAAGSIKLFFNDPRTMTIPKGTRFSDSTGNLVFETAITYTITKQTMSTNRDIFPYYNTTAIPLEAEKEGEDYNLDANTITRNVTLPVTPARIINNAPTSDGGDRETNSELYERILTSFYNPSPASSAGLSRILRDNFSLTDVEIVGAGDPQMKRDLIAEIQQIDDVKIHDFYLVNSGIHSYPWKEHTAYTGNFVDIDETEQVSLPEPGAFDDEFSNSMYEGIFFRNDQLYSQQDEYTILQEYFEDPNDPDIQFDLHTVRTSGQWLLHDGVNPSNEVFYLGEIDVENGYVRLGKHVDLTPDADGNINDAELLVNIPYTTLNGLFTLLTDTLNSQIIGGDEIDDEEDADEWSGDSV